MVVLVGREQGKNENRRIGLHMPDRELQIDALDFLS